MKRILLTILTAGCMYASNGQTLTQQGTHEISGKANRGYLYEPKVDAQNQEISLTFVTKASGKNAKFETYKFDFDFKFKGMEPSEVPLERIKGYKSDKGEEYSYDAVTVETNLMGTLVLKRKIYKKKWNWFWGGYDTKISFGEKIKPKSDDGGKFQYMAHAELPESGNILIFAGDKGTGLGNTLKMTTEIHVLRFDGELNKTTDQLIKFDFPQTIVATSTDDQDEDADTDSDVLLLFAPLGGKAFKKSADPNAMNYTFVRVGADGTIKERISLASKAGVFNGNMFMTIGNDVLILGAAGEKTDDYYNEKFPSLTISQRETELENFKAKGFQIIKISGGKMSYATLTTLDEFDQKSQAPPSQKKKPEYTGKKFRLADIKLLHNGDILLAGQKYTKPKSGGHTNKLLGGMGSSGSGGPEYEDIIMMHFAPNGTLRTAYGVRREENDKEAKSSPNNQLIMESNDGKSVYWCIMEMKGWRQEKELGESKYKFLLYPSVSKIDVANAKIGNFVQFGQGKTDFFLNNKYPLLPGNTNELIFLGESKSGKTLWFGKMPLE